MTSPNPALIMTPNIVDQYPCNLTYLCNPSSHHTTSQFLDVSACHEYRISSDQWSSSPKHKFGEFTRLFQISDDPENPDCVRFHRLISRAVVHDFFRNVHITGRLSTQLHHLYHFVRSERMHSLRNIS